MLRSWAFRRSWISRRDRKSTRLNSSHTEIYTLSLHDALPILSPAQCRAARALLRITQPELANAAKLGLSTIVDFEKRSEEHTSELQSHRDLHSFPTRRSSDLVTCSVPSGTCIIKNHTTRARKCCEAGPFDDRGFRE